MFSIASEITSHT